MVIKMKSVRKSILKSLVVKEFKQTLRDKRMVMMLFGMPVIMLFVFGYAVNTDVNRIKMAVLDEDRSVRSREFLRRFTASGYFIHSESIAAPGESARLLDGGEVDIYMHIPRGFGERVVSGKGAQVQIILDGTDSNRAAVIQAYVNQIAGDYSLAYFGRKVRMLVLGREAGGMRMKEPLEVKERALFNPDLASRNFYLPGVLGLLVALITIMLTSMSVVKERESGTIEQIIVSPLRPLEFVIGKTLPFAIIGFIDICVITIIAITWFRVPFNGSFGFLLLGSFFYIICTLAVGLYISTVSLTQQQAMLSTFLFFIPAILFSGFIFPIYAMPEVFQLISLLNPMRYFITVIRGIFLKGVGAAVLWKEVTALVLLGTVLLWLSVRRFSRRLE